MVSIHPQFVIDKDKQTKAVLLPFSEWEQIIDALEELDDIRAYDLAKADSSECLDFEQSIFDMKEEDAD